MRRVRVVASAPDAGVIVRFHDRREAGRVLGEVLAQREWTDPVVLGLPRGGVPVAAEVASRLRAPLDVLVVRKLGHPAQPELAVGAIGEGGVRVLNEALLATVEVDPSTLEAITRREMAELERRLEVFRPSGRPPVSLEGRTAILVDDGIATGSTVRAACAVVRARGARRVVVAAPIGPVDAPRRLGAVADEVVLLDQPGDFTAVGQGYVDFTQTTDEEVRDLLEQARHHEAAREIHVGPGLPGTLTVPTSATGLVVFAHGSGSSRHSPRNRRVAAALHEAGQATLLFDLLTPDEARDRANVFDVELLAGRLVAATQDAVGAVASPIPVGYFGANTGAAAALVAAAALGDDIAAVVSRGGRPDLAGPRLAQVRAPTLLIVGEADPEVVALNQAAMERMRAPVQMVVVPGATHLFEEPGALEEVASHARRWFAARFGERRVA